MFRNLLSTATVAAIFGVLGAMGYSHFFGSKPGDPSLFQSKTEAELSTKTKSDGGPNTDSANASSNRASIAIPGSGSDKEVYELKQQIISLNQRIDRFGEQVDRIHQLLSLAVPLLQRIAPKS
jgi:hypothetical protein